MKGLTNKRVLVTGGANGIGRVTVQRFLEIAALFAFLASDEAPFLHGTSVIVDGGETAGGLASQCRRIE